LPYDFYGEGNYKRKKTYFKEGLHEVIEKAFEELKVRSIKI
jgi:hypothetical protein